MSSRSEGVASAGEKDEMPKTIPKAWPAALRYRSLAYTLPGPRRIASKGIFRRSSALLMCTVTVRSSLDLTGRLLIPISPLSRMTMVFQAKSAQLAESSPSSLPWRSGMLVLCCTRGCMRIQLDIISQKKPTTF